MSRIQIDDCVQLMLDLPELGLRRGDLGMVCSTWFSPITAYEVKFQRKTPPDCVVHTLLMLEQIKGKADL